MTDPRLQAIRWLSQVVDKGRSVNHLLAEYSTNQEPALSPQQKALAKQLLFGCLRFYFQLKTLADNLMAKPLKPKDHDVLMSVILGLYQIKYLSTPDHAAISESVELAKKLRKSWATGLINGVLREYQRNHEAIEAKLQKSIQFQTAHPGWIVKKIKQDWSDEANGIVQNNNLQAPMILRVNQLRLTREQYLKQLEVLDLSAKLHPVASDAIILDNAVDVMKLPGFTQGEVTVQDAAAQLAVEMLDLQPGQKVLDGCAAPGGKTTHILQRESSVQLTSVELSPARAEKIRQTLARMQLNSQVMTADITQIERWWDGQLFDRILLDVPCSATGVIRRNPDVKIHRKVTDIQPLVTLQQTILDQCWSLLKPGGILVYATCSVFKVENEQQIQIFQAKHKPTVLQMPEAIHNSLSRRAAVGYQIVPGEFQMDGFYLCGLRKFE
ncbi:16S rRNA (cytosine(967)-C(5))-methyltransferase RsmB [Aliikangiella sp. IMCC44359]|uniref:16S rRNA (cytosine(967)-C(5))-methyltransferase RsmB n=1 Tax=Aliikangiella sp. IMCC44359 TaxID=3459125 RepID=UPI00403B23BB